MIRRFYFKTKFGNISFDSPSFHTALRKLGSWLENNELNHFKVEGTYDFHFILDKIEKVN